MGYYIGLTKRKIKEHKRDIHNGREKTAIAKITLNDTSILNVTKLRN